MVNPLDEFREVWLIDFEFISNTGERPVPVCLVAMEYRSKRTVRLWYDEFEKEPPFSSSKDTLFVAFFASAELGCYQSLKWDIPKRVLDLFTEFRNLTNGLGTVSGNGLVGAMVHFGLDSIGAEEKDTMRDLVLRGGPWSWEERNDILNYCESDVVALSRLLPVMLPHINTTAIDSSQNWTRAILRGRYMAASARMEFTGTPINLRLFNIVKEKWTSIQDQLIEKIDVNYGVYEGRTFKYNKFLQWTLDHEIDWPVLPTDHLDMEDDTFRDMSKIYPIVSSLRELRHCMSKLRLNDLSVGDDGFNRCILSPFAARSGRNQPSNSRYIFGPSVWMRGFIQPPPGYGVAYIDWSQQEVGIAAGLSKDPNLINGYLTGDSYLAFAKLAGGVPADATKETHELEREPFKQCVLGVQYSMWERALAKRIGKPIFMARRLLALHHELYKVFWKWSDNNVDYASLYNIQATVFGWTNRVPPKEFKDRSHRNFHMQANGAEMLRLACCLGTEHGIQITSPVHDAVMIMAPIGRLDRDIQTMREIMGHASNVVLGGILTLRTDVKKVIYPDHYSDKRGVEMWKKVMELL
jgi:DNA polymerase I